jgi:hypothetical protein
MNQPFQFRLVAVCPSGHETELISVRLDPADNSTLAAAESAIPPEGIVGKCNTCLSPTERVRTYVDGALVEEVSHEEFERRAKGKAPPRNYG